LKVQDKSRSLIDFANFPFYNVENANRFWFVQSFQEDFHTKTHPPLIFSRAVRYLGGNFFTELKLDNKTIERDQAGSSALSGKRFQRPSAAWRLWD
jgi:hypothetical protein